MRNGRIVVLIAALSIVSVAAPPASAVDLAPGDIVVGEPFVRAVTRVDPVTGAHTTISSGHDLFAPNGIAMDPRGRILVAELGGSGSLVRVSPATGEQVVVSEGGNFKDVRGVAVEATGKILVVDGQCCGGNGALIRVDPETGAQRVVSSGGLLDIPNGATVESSGTILVTGLFMRRVVRVDPMTGAQSVVTSGGNLFAPYDVAVEESGDILVADNNNKVIRVDPATGAQSIVSSGGRLSHPVGIAVERSGDVLVLDETCCADEKGGVIRVDPSTGAQTVVSSGFGGFGRLGGIDVVSPGIQDLFVLDSGAVTSSGNAIAIGGISCLLPERWTVAVTIRQRGGASGQDRDAGPCSDGIWAVEADHGPGPAFTAGKANVCVAARLLRAGELRDRRSVCDVVELHG